MKKKLLSVVLCTAMMAAMVTGCGSSASSTSSSAAASAPAASAAATSAAASSATATSVAATSAAATSAAASTAIPAGNVPASSITIGSVIMNTSGEWFAEVMQGQQAAADKLGIKINMVSADNDLSKESDYVDQFVSQGVKALVICPISADSSVAAIQEATKAKIPVVNWNCTVNTDTNSFIGVDANALGGKTGEYLADYIPKHFPKGCKMALLTNSSYEIGKARCKGFEDAIKPLVDSGKVTIVNKQDAESQDEGMTVTEQMLAANPDINVIWAWNQTSLLGAAAELQNQQNNKIILSGTDMSVQLAKDMQGSEINLQVVTTQQPYQLGYQAVMNAYKLIEGQKVDKQVMIPVSVYSKDDMSSITKYVADHKDLVK